MVSNRCSWAILGYPHDAMVGKGWADLFFDREENRLFNQVIVDVIWEEKLNLHRLAPYTQPSGDTRYLSITTSFIKSGRGMEGIVVLLDDITELRRIQIHEKIILQEKESLQRDRTEGLHKLAMAIAHQLRNPTTAIGGLALRMLKRRDVEPVESPYLQNILNCVQRLEAIVTSIQEYTQLPAVMRTKAPITRMLAQVEEHAVVKAMGLGKRLQLRIDSSPFEVDVDAQLLVQALDEILANAVEFCRDCIAEVHVAVSRAQSGLIIEVTDRGVGISPRDLPYIFDPFFTTKAVGVGMGLCKARRIVSEHGGQIWAEREDGEGTRVVVQIPELFENISIEGENMSGIGETVVNHVIVLSLKGRLDSTSAGELREKVRDCLKKNQIHIVIDLAEIDFVDSSGLGSLVTCLRSANKVGGDIKIAAVQDRVRAVFELIRLHRVFDIYDDRFAASEAFHHAAS